MAKASFRSTFHNPVDTVFDLQVAEPQDGYMGGSMGGGDIRGHNFSERGEAQQAPILVLSRYSAVIETVRKLAPRGVPVVQAPDLDHAAEKMPSLKPGVLVADTASTSDIAAMVARLSQHFPELVVVVAGQREDSAALAQLTATGKIFRFVLVPLSHGQTRLMLEAALAQHKKLTAPVPPPIEEHSIPEEAEKTTYTAGYIAFALGFAIAVGAVGWFVFRASSTPASPVAPVAAVPAPVSAVASRPDPVKVELSLAREAFDRGQYVEPAGASALDHYRSILSIDPNGAAAQEGLRSVADKILERAESALFAGKIEDALKAMEIARGIDPQQLRLAYLDAQVARERERIKLLQSQAARPRIDTFVSKVGAPTNQSRLVTPAADSMRNAPLEPRATPLAKPASKPAPVVKPADDAGKELVASIRRMLSEGKLIDPNGESAKEALATLRAMDPGRAELNELAGTLSDRLLESSKQALVDKAFDRSQQLLAAARDVGAAGKDGALSQAERELMEARANAVSNANSIVPAATLRRIKMVEPVYPAAARRRNEKGVVELAFTVTPDGSVTNVEVRKSNPAKVFDDAAMQAVQQWQFEPVKVNGQTVSQRAVVRLFFSMD